MARREKTLAQLELDAKNMVRQMKPDLVVLAIPTTTDTDTDEQRVHSISWIMNLSLSFGRQEWDCFVVHPRVIEPSADVSQSRMIRRLVRAQHLALIDRKADDPSTAEAILRKWFESQ